MTTGPGGTNCTTGVACSWIDSVPTIFISGQVFLNQTIKNTGKRQVGVQEINIIDMVKKFTKYSVMVNNPNDILFHLEKAYHVATTGRPGPVWIDIPADIQSSKIELKKLKKFKPKIKKKISKLIDLKIKKVAELLKKSKRPILHVGQGVRIANAQKQLRNFLNKSKIPFALTWNASDIIESSHPSYIGRPGAFAERGTNFIIQNSDLYISVGTRLPFMVTGYNSNDFARRATKVMVDIDLNEVRNTRVPINLGINCDANYFFKKITEYLSSSLSLSKNWHIYCKNIRKKYPIVLNKYKKQKKIFKFLSFY